MNYLDTVHKRKSATITTIIMVLLLLIILVFGLKYMDPPIESGIAVNFGTSNVGSGNIQPTTPVKTIVNPQVTKEEADVQQSEEASLEEESLSEEVLTQDSEESIKIKEQQKADKILKDAEVAAEKAKIEADLKAKADAEKLQKEQDDKKKKLDAIFGGLENNDGAEEGGEGDDKVGGDKGKETGDLDSKGYLGNGGSGGNGNYRLGNRKPLNTPEPKYQCEEEGLVIVRIEVDREGNVIKATAGVKGSTNTAICLLSQAEIAARETKWSPDSKAGVKQVGEIRYKFSLTN